MQPCDDMDEGGGTMCATRTKPAIASKHAKRVGATKAKKLDVAENVPASDVLPYADTTMHRALSARCSYLCQDRPGIYDDSEDLCRESAVLTVTSFKKKVGSVSLWHEQTSIPLCMARCAIGA